MRDRYTILFLHPSDELYGSDQMLLHLVRAMAPGQFRVLVVLPRDLAYSGALSDRLRGAGADVRIIELGVVRRRYLTIFGIPLLAWRLVLSVTRLSRLIRQEKVDVVHTNTMAVWSGGLAAWLTRRPHLWHVHELVTGGRWLRSILGRSLAALAGTVVVNSQASADALFGPRRLDKVQILPNGIEMPRQSGPDARRRVREEWAVTDGQVLVASIGRLSYRKGQRQLISAASEVLAQDKRVRFALVGGTVPGDQGFLLELLGEVATLGIGSSVIFPGFRTDVDEILDATDIFVMPSFLPEPFGLAAVEAMAHSKPVIGTRAGGLADVVVEGVTGLLVPPGDASQLATAILRLARDPLECARMGAAGRRRVMSYYTLDVYTRRYREIYSALLGPA